MMFFFLLFVSYLCLKMIGVCVIWWKVAKFVEKVFKREGDGKEEDSSHGYQHAKDVFWLSLWIYFMDSIRFNVMFNWTILRLVGVVSLCHDVDDKKIKGFEERKKKLEKFLIDEFGLEWKLIKDIIDRISHSKERNSDLSRKTDLDWLSVLGLHGVIVRNCVSDADKIESLGKTGHERSKEFNRKSLKDGEGEKELFQLVEWIMNDKLRTLDEWMWTSYGKELGKRKRIEICLVHEKWRKELFL